MELRKIVVHFLPHITPSGEAKFKTSFDGSEKQLERVFACLWENSRLSVPDQMCGYDYNVIFSCKSSYLNQMKGDSQVCPR